MLNTREALIELVEKGYNKYFNPNSKGNLFEVIADHLIANGVTVQEWIPASEPPKEKGRYWCNVKSFAYPGKFYQRELKWDDGFVEGYIYTDMVTHWMPLPEPPKGE